MTETRRTQSGRIFHRQNCQNIARKSHTNKFGDVISLFGRHGFEWKVGIVRVSNPCFMILTQFEDRAKAIAYYEKMCKQY